MTVDCVVVVNLYVQLSPSDQLGIVGFKLSTNVAVGLSKLITPNITSFVAGCSGSACNGVNLHPAYYYFTAYDVTVQLRCYCKPSP